MSENEASAGAFGAVSASSWSVIIVACLVQYTDECNHAGLAGKTDLEQARADMIIDCIDDTYKPLLSFMFEADETRKVWTDKHIPLVKHNNIPSVS